MLHLSREQSNSLSVMTKTSFYTFCRKNYHKAYAPLALGMVFEGITNFLPKAFRGRIALIGIVIAVISGVVLVAGLIAEGRQRKQDRPDSGKAGDRFLIFCRRNYFNAFVVLGVGMTVHSISSFLPEPFHGWIGSVGIVIAVAGAIVLGIGLIAEGRQRKQDDAQCSNQ